MLFSYRPQITHSVVHSTQLSEFSSRTEDTLLSMVTNLKMPCCVVFFHSSSQVDLSPCLNLHFLGEHKLRQFENAIFISIICFTTLYFYLKFLFQFLFYWPILLKIIIICVCVWTLNFSKDLRLCLLFWNHKVGKVMNISLFYRKGN